MRDRDGAVAVDSKEKADYRDSLDAFYQAAQAAIDAKTADVLKRLIDDLPQ